jgi:hypothetical protein
MKKKKIFNLFCLNFEEEIHRSVSLRELLVSEKLRFRMKTTCWIFHTKYSGEILWRYLQYIDQSGVSNRRNTILSSNRNQEFLKYKQKVALLYSKEEKWRDRNEV